MYKRNDDYSINVTFDKENSGEKHGGTRTDAGKQNPKKQTRYIIVSFKIILYKDMRYINLDFKLGTIIIRMPAEECFSAHYDFCQPQYSPDDHYTTPRQYKPSSTKTHTSVPIIPKLLTIPSQLLPPHSFTSQLPPRFI